MQSKLIPSLPGYVIDSLGRVWKMKGQKECRVDNILQGSKLVCSIHGNQYEIFYLLCETFGITFSPLDKVKYRINRKLLTLSVDSIKITPIAKRSVFDSKEQFEMRQYLCREKASGSNGRFIEKITEVEVYLSLQRSNYSCFYCGKKLDPKAWQIDHFHPRFHGGKNVSSNIVASCPACNIMKHTLDGNHFIKRCCTIANRLKKTLPKEPKN